jgi:endonuclease YncB( thermonuclease family)
MATKELQDIIDGLPDIDRYKYPFCECYAFNSRTNYNEVLLDSGLIVKADARINYHGTPDLKSYLKTYLGDNVTYIGKGVIHK